MSDALDPTTRARRRVIDRALERRPDLEVDELVALLARLDVPADRATLLADLDALGFEVDDDAPPPPEPRAPEAADAFADPPPAAATRGRRGRLVVPALAGVGAVALVVVALALPDDGDPAGVPSGDSGVPVQTVAPPGRDAALEDTAALNLALAFEEEGAGLPPVDDLGEWRTPQGAWTQADGAATVALEDGGALAWLPTPGPDLRVEVAVGDLAPNAGLALRVADDDSYLAWVAQPDYSVVNLWRVADGVRTPLANSGFTDLPPGVRLGANLRGEVVELLVGGEVVATYTDTESAGAAGLGLVVLGGGPASVATGTSFDDLRVLFAD